MREDWLVVAISGVTNAGKTTLTNKLKAIIPNCECIYQDLYFREVDDKNHVYLDDIGHNNWELLTAVNTDKLWDDIQKVLKRPRVDQSKKNILLIDGFLVLNFEKTIKLCDLKYYLKLSEDECRNRRKGRDYNPPDVPGYFDKVVWPEHLKSFQEMLEMNDRVVIMNGSCSVESNMEQILQDINCRSKV